MHESAELKLLIDSAKRGDVEAFGRLVALFRPRIARIVARYANGEEDREDLLQDVFIRAFRSLKNYRGKGSFEGWLHKVAVHTSLDWLRKKMRRREKSESELTSGERNWLQERFSDDSGGSPYESAQGNMYRDILNKALDDLSPEDRTAITLFELEGISVEEISRITGWSKSNVKVRCHRARIRLANWLREKGEEI